MATKVTVGSFKIIGPIIAVAAAVGVLLLLREGSEDSMPNGVVHRVESKPSPARHSAETDASAKHNEAKPHATRALRQGWYSRFKDSRDYVPLVLSAAKAAEQGDHEAAWELSHLMYKCAPVIRSVRSGQTRDAYLAANSFLTASDPQYAATIAQKYDACAALGSAPELSKWVQSFGKLGVKHWRDLALELGNPAAKAEQVIQIGSSLSNVTDEQRQEKLNQVRAYVSDTIRSQDGEAWFQLGMRLGNGDFSKDVTRGFALALASCDLGYDCTGQNARNNWCGEGRRCNLPMDLDQQLKQMLSPGQHANVYAKYQELTQLIERGEWEEIERKYVPLDGPAFSG